MCSSSMGGGGVSCYWGEHCYQTKAAIWASTSVQPHVLSAFPSSFSCLCLPCLNQNQAEVTGGSRMYSLPEAARRERGSRAAVARFQCRGKDRWHELNSCKERQKMKVESRDGLCCGHLLHTSMDSSLPQWHPDRCCPPAHSKAIIATINCL